ncbi:Neurofilament, light polypeptide b [Balamuthia mandrillaris]
MKRCAEEQGKEPQRMKQRRLATRTWCGQVNREETPQDEATVTQASEEEPELLKPARAESEEQLSLSHNNSLTTEPEEQAEEGEEEEEQEEEEEEEKQEEEAEEKEEDEEQAEEEREPEEEEEAGIHEFLKAEDPRQKGNANQAFQFYLSAAEQGHTVGLFRVGWCYDTGTGVDKDHSQAVHWWRSAAGFREATMRGGFEKQQWKVICLPCFTSEFVWRVTPTKVHEPKRRGFAGFGQQRKKVSQRLSTFLESIC